MTQVRSGVVLQGAYEPPLFGDMVAEIDALGSTTSGSRTPRCIRATPTPT